MVKKVDQDDALFTPDVTISRFPTALSSMLYVLSAVAVSTGPVFLFASVFGLTLEGHLPIIAVVSAVIVAGLVSSYGNVTFTSQLALHRSQKQLADMSPSSTPVSHDDIARASVAYSLYFNNFVYTVVFVLLSLGLSSGLNVVIRFGLASILPLLVNGYLTKPVAK